MGSTQASNEGTGVSLASFRAWPARSLPVALDLAAVDAIRGKSVD